MSDTTPATVFIVDDDQAVRKAVEWLVRSEGLNAVAYETAEQFLRAYDPSVPGCVVLDIRMPGLSGLELQTRLAEMNIAIPVIMVTGHATVTMAVHAMKLGAVDFIEKPLNRELLLRQIRVAIARDNQLRQRSAAHHSVGARLSELTPRERQVMDLIIAGRLNKQIADELGLSPRTVEKHRAQIMSKMEANTVAELVHMVLQAKPAS